jgi:hypothetical protein
MAADEKISKAFSLIEKKNGWKHATRKDNDPERKVVEFFLSIVINSFRVDRQCHRREGEEKAHPKPADKGKVQMIKDQGGEACQCDDRDGSRNDAPVVPPEIKAE